ncbi:MAG TPA: thioredoxin domain-containing protein [Gaiellaceae bacterium]|jgi:protein-disulfide isomerase
MRGALAGAFFVVVLAVGGYAVLGHASNGQAALSRFAVGATGDDGPTITIVSGTPKVGKSSGSSALPGARRVAKLFKGIHQKGLVLGRSKARVTLIEYVDLQCPACQEFEAKVVLPLVKKYVRRGKLEIKMQPWNILDANVGGHDSLRGQKATIAAARQNKAFNFAEVLYDNQGVEGTGWMNDAMISKIAASVDRLRPYTLAKDANGGATRRVVKSIDHWGKTHPRQMLGTPTIYLVRGHGRPKYYETGVPKLGKLEAAINALLK